MSDYICMLITILYDDALMRVALKVKKDQVEGDWEEYPMEPENREKIHAMLPAHVSNCGPIVNVEPLFEVIA